MSIIHTDLNRARLPIPPYPHCPNIILHRFKKKNSFKKISAVQCGDVLRTAFIGGLSPLRQFLRPIHNRGIYFSS